MRTIRYPCEIPSTSIVEITPASGSYTYQIFDKSGHVIWKGFISYNEQSGIMTHTVDTFKPDIMIVRQLAALGDMLEKRLALEQNAIEEGGLLTLSIAAETAVRLDPLASTYSP